VATQKRRPKPPATTGRFRRRQIELPDGAKLVLHDNGSITQLDAGGEVKAEWSVEDPAWPQHALRFGLQPQPATVVPEGRRRAEPRPQDG
jgi:hypothetical protein